MNTPVDRLAFDPSLLPARQDVPTDDQAFFKWFPGIKTHHEFPELERLLVAVSQNTPDRFDFEWNVLWHAYRAATWRPEWTADQEFPPWARLGVEAMQAAERLQALAKTIERAGVEGLKFVVAGFGATECRDAAAVLTAQAKAISNVVLADFQHGPFIRRGGVSTTSRLPSAATMLAAQLGYAFKRQNLPPSWTLLAKLISVSGIAEDVAPESLRVAAQKLIHQIERGELRLVAWPQDTGRDLHSVMRFLDRDRNRTRNDPTT